VTPVRGRVQTVRGPIDPSELGWTLPREHTAIALWHVPDRWDYWELRRDEPVIVEELGSFRDAGGSTVVDLTLPGVGRDPSWLQRVSEASGLNVVMGTGWYRDAYYPAETLIDRRSVDSLADEIVREASDGVGESGVRPGIIGEIGTDKPWISPREERVHRAAARAARRTGLAITTHAVQSTVGLDQLDLFEAEGADLSRVVIGHADSNPSPEYHRAIVERGATIEFDFLGMSFTPLERHGRGGSSSRSATCWRAATSSGSCCHRTCATTRSSSATAGTATRTSPTRSSRGCARQASPRARSGRSRSRTRAAC
jgi:phosphotriesterase-related protein